MENGLHIEYLPVNQAYAIMWHDTILRIITDKREVVDYLAEICGRKYQESYNRLVTKAFGKKYLKERD